MNNIQLFENKKNSNWGTICTPVEMLTADGKKRKIQAANMLTENND